VGCKRFGAITRLILTRPPHERGMAGRRKPPLPWRTIPADREQPTVALNVYAQLAINGQALSASVSIASLGGVDLSVNHIEAHGYYHELVALPGDRGVKLQPGPITFTKRIDDATPRLMQAWAGGQTIDGAFKFFDRHPEDGSIRLLQVYIVQQGVITAVRTEMVSNLHADGANIPVLERVTLTYRSFRVDHVPSGQTWNSNLSSVA